jgi:hypothetical protein
MQYLIPTPPPTLHRQRRPTAVFNSSRYRDPFHAVVGLVRIRWEGTEDVGMRAEWRTDLEVP